MGNEPHTEWYTRCRRAQEQWKARTRSLDEASRAPGKTFTEARGERIEVGPFPVCLPLESARSNLLPEIRDEAVQLFDELGIEWHGASPSRGRERWWPSSHLLDSQVQCVNSLLALERSGQLVGWVRSFLDCESLEVVERARMVTFEWNGGPGVDWLDERHGRPFVRGRYQTSADAFLVARTGHGRVGLLVEWKFTEFYTRPVPLIAYRRRRYEPRYLDRAGPFTGVAPFDALFHEPHYQLLRLHLLADQLLRRDPSFSSAVVVHVVPEANVELRGLVPGALRAVGGTVPEVWAHMLRPDSGLRYVCVPSESLLRSVPSLADRYAL